MLDHKAVPELGRVDDNEHSGMVGALFLKGLLSAAGITGWQISGSSGASSALLPDLTRAVDSQEIKAHFPSSTCHASLLRRGKAAAFAATWQKSRPKPLVIASCLLHAVWQVWSQTPELSERWCSAFRNWNIAQSGTNVTNSTPCSKFTMQQPAVESRFDVQSV